MIADEQTGALVSIPNGQNAYVLFAAQDTAAIDAVLDLVRKKIDAFIAENRGADTAADRDAIRSFAHKVTKSKTALEEVGAELAKEAKKIPGLIDATRRHIKTTLDAWRDEVRKPLTDWEKAEEDRIRRIRDDLDKLQIVIADTAERTSDAIRERVSEVQADFLDISEERFGEYAISAAVLKANALAVLDAKLAVTLEREADAAELAALRAQAEERAKKDREEQIAREAAAKATADAEAAAQAERDAAAKREADLRAAAERAEQEKRDAEDRAARSAQEAKEAAEREAREVKEREESAQRQREQDKAHRAAINREALAALVKGGIDIEVAKNVIVLIATRAIPHISINY